VTLELNADATVSAGLNGEGLLTKTGPGTLILGGAAAGTATGGIMLEEGKIRVNTSASVGAATQVVSISNDATFEWNTTGDSNPDTRIINVLAGGATLSSTLAAQGNAVIFSKPTTLLGTEPITKSGVGVLRFTVAQNSLFSPWNVNQGTIETQVAAGFGTGPITVNSGGLVVIHGNVTPAVVLPNNITLNGGSLGVRSGNTGVYGTPSSSIDVLADSGLSVRSNSTQANGQTYAIAALVTGSGGLTVTGPASVNFGGVIFQNTENTYSGLLTIGARQFATSASPTGTGDTLGTAGIALGGGTLNVLDNGTADNGVITFAHNVTIGAPTDVLFPSSAVINVNRQSTGTFSGNTVEFGQLTIGAQPLILTSANGYAVSFASGTLTDSATINTASTPVTIGSIGGGAFNLTKVGAGTLRLNGASTFTGNVISSAGTLQVAGSISGGVEVTTSTLKITGPVGGNVTAVDSVVNLASSILGNLAVGGASTLNGASTISGTLNVGNGVTINPGDDLHHGALRAGDTTFGATATDTALLNFYVDSVAANRGYLETGALSVFEGATVTLRLLNALPAVGFYPIIDYGDATIDAATFNAFTLAPIANPRIIAALNHNTTSNIIELNVSAVDAPRWTGAGNGVWTTEVQTPKNWALIIGSGATDFLASDEVLFDNLAANRIVNLTAQDVSPSKITFKNSLGNDYTVNGTFAINGEGALFKSGTGSVTINNTNGFTGDVTATGGALNFNSIADIGLPSALGAGAAIGVDGATLNYTGPAASSNRTITVGAGGGTFAQDGTGDLTLAGDLLGTGIFTKTGPGKLILTGSASTVGGVQIDAGILQLGDGLATGGAPGSGPIVNHSQLILNPGGALALISTISGSGTVTKEGFGSATLGGSLANTYTGLTTVTAGTLFAGKVAGVQAIGGDLLVLGGGTFRYSGDNTPNQIPDTATVTLDGGNFGDPLNANPLSPSFTDTIANLAVKNGGSFASGRNALLTPFTVTGTTTVNAGSILAQRGGGMVTDALTVEASGSARLDGGSTTAGQESRITVGAGGLTLHDGHVQFNAGPSTLATNSAGSIFVLNGDLISTGVSDFTRGADVAVKAQIDLGGGTRTFHVTDTLSIGAVGGALVNVTNGGIIKAGPGTLRITGASTYAGGTTITEGQLSLLNGVPGTGPLTLNTNPLLVETTADTTLTNTISGAGGVEKSGPAVLRYQGAAANTYAGLTHLLSGTMIAQKPAGIIAIPGDFTIEAGATFRFSSNVPQNQIADTSTVTVAGTFGTPTDATAGVGDTIANLNVKTGGLFVSGRNMVTLGARTPFSITGVVTNEAGGTLLASRGGGIFAGKLISSGNLNLDGGATGGQESHILIGQGGLELNSGIVNFNTGTASAVVANSKGSVLVLNGDVTSTGTTTLVNMTSFTGPLANVELVGDRTFDVSDLMTIGTVSNRVNLVDGVTGTSGGLIKAGGGTLELAGANTYTGPTDVQDGILAITGSLSGSSNITVRTGALLEASGLFGSLNIGTAQILSGSGTVAGTVLIDGALAPGAPGAFEIGHLTVNGSLTFGAFSNSNFELTKTAISGDSDLLTLSGDGHILTFDGTLHVTFTGGLADNDTFNLFDAPAFAGNFTALDLQDPGNGLFWNTDNLTVNGTITVVPEPTGCALLLGGLSLLAARRRRGAEVWA
jgi:fibronectin-binding autotransporter adhesin